MKTHGYHTASAPYQVVLIPEKSRIFVGKLYYIQVQVLDKIGNLCYNADNRISFAVSVVGEYISYDSGDYFGFGNCAKGYDPEYWYDVKCS